MAKKLFKAADLKTLHKALLAKEAAVKKDIEDLELSLKSLDKSSSAGDDVDRSSLEEETQRLQSVLAGKQHLQSEIRAALERFNEGSYGICEDTEETIEVVRLKAQPWVRLSLEAQKEREYKFKRGTVAGRTGVRTFSAFGI